MPRLRWHTRSGWVPSSEDRLFAAVAALLETTPWEHLPVASIVASAGTTPAAFYARHPRRDDLLTAMHERYCQEATQTASAALAPERWRGVPLPQVIGRLVEFLVTGQPGRRGVRRAFITRAAWDPAFARRIAELDEVVVTGITRLLLARPEELGTTDVERAARLLHRLTIAVVDHAALHDRADTAELCTEVTKALVAYLEA